jgi:glyceraldehyde-3-phosphate dehydrogenase/erythrose-4-phosphate dehydrogenase
MPVPLAINGFGRVGRCVLRSDYEQDANLEVVAKRSALGHPD